jgi:preprotein translocase subunit SecG
MQTLNVLLTMVYVFCCLFLAFVVLLQKGEGGGLGGLAGSSGAVDNAMGSQASMAMKKATAWAAGLFMILAIMLGVLSNQIHSAAGNSFKAEQDKDKATASPTPGATPAASGAPAATPAASKTE